MLLIFAALTVVTARLADGAGVSAAGPILVDSLDGAGGVVGPIQVPLANRAEACVADWLHLRRHHKRLGFRTKPKEKAAHIFVPSCRELALQNAIVRVARKLVGTDMMLATMSVLIKPAGWNHRWHSDIENSVDPERCDGSTSWTVWLPLKV